MAAGRPQTPVTGIRVQAHGDAYLVNVGGSATPERALVLDINHLDETLPAPWEWDLKRLVASFALTRSVSRRDYVRSHLPPAMRDFSTQDVLQTRYARLGSATVLAMLPESQKAVVTKRIAKTTARSNAELAHPTLVEKDVGHPRSRDMP